MFQTWKSVYPLMYVGWAKFVSFKDFKKQLMGNQVSYTEKSDEDIVKEINERFKINGS